jgi:putative ABC transport system ATP-binding protein
LFELNHATGTTLVLVTHDERMAARCHRTIELASGRLVNDARNAPQDAQPAGTASSS